VLDYLNVSFTRSKAACLRFFSFTQSFDGPSFDGPLRANQRSYTKPAVYNFGFSCNSLADAADSIKLIVSQDRHFAIAVRRFLLSGDFVPAVTAVTDQKTWLKSKDPASAFDDQG